MHLLLKEESFTNKAESDSIQYLLSPEKLLAVLSV